MKAHPYARLAVTVSSATAMVVADRAEVALVAGGVAVALLISGEWRLCLRLAGTISLVLLVSASLWLIVLGDVSAPRDSIGALADPHAPFQRLVRTMAGSAGLVLALGTIPDGELVGFLRRLGLPLPAAIAAASGAASAAGVGESLGRTLAALRAQGFVGPGRLGGFIGFPAVVGVIWVASLSTAVDRAEGTWVRNGLLDRLPAPAPVMSPDRVWGTLVLTATAGFLVLALVTGGRFVYPPV